MNTAPSKDPPDPGRGHHIREMLQGSSKAFIIRAVGTGAAVAVHIFVARTIGQEEFGAYSFALAVIGTLAIVSRVGFGTSVRRFVAQYRRAGENRALAGLGAFSFLAVAAVAGVLALGLGLFLKSQGNSLPLQQSDALLAATWLLPPLALMGVAQALLIGLKRIGPAVFMVQILRPGLLVLFLWAFCHLLGLAPVAPTALRAETLAVTLTMAALGLWYLKASKSESNWARPRIETRAWLAVSLPLMLMNSLQVLFNQTDIIMLGAITTSSETGVYSSAARIARLVLFGLTAINTAMAPMISEMYHAGRLDRLRSLLGISARILLAFTALVLLFLVLAGKWVLGLFGDGVPAAWPVMLILAAGQAVNSLSGPAAYCLTMTGRQNVAAKIIIVSATANILLNVLLIPRWGIYGAAVATSISIVIWNVWMVQASKSVLGINPSVFRRWW